jgi:hypothetical protein
VDDDSTKNDSASCVSKNNVSLFSLAGFVLVGFGGRTGLETPGLDGGLGLFVVVADCDVTSLVDRSDDFDCVVESRNSSKLSDMLQKEISLFD